MPIESEPVLTADGLWKRYRRRGPWVLQDVSVGIPAGSITAIVGPNGAGKSTLIRTWVGFERPSKGSVSVIGVDPWQDRPAALAKIGYVPQAASLYRDLTVRDHLQLAAGLRAGFDQSIARRRMIDLGIPPRQRAGDLSGGQQAQLGLAIALATRAPVLLLDEPLASLDPLARRDFLRVLVQAVREDGTTAFLSSHIVTDVEDACDRVIVLGGGRVLLDDSVAAARALHTVSTGGATTADALGSFFAADGSTVTLLRGENAAGERRATLEEIVLGYLSAGQQRASVEAEWAAA